MEHGGGDAVHDWLRLNVEVPVELIRAPPVDEANAVAINPGAHEGHGAAGPSRPCRNFRGKDAQVREEDDLGSYKGGAPVRIALLESLDGGGLFS